MKLHKFFFFLNFAFIIASFPINVKDKTSLADQSIRDNQYKRNDQESGINQGSRNNQDREINQGDRNDQGSSRDQSRENNQDRENNQGDRNDQGSSRDQDRLNGQGDKPRVSTSSVTQAVEDFARDANLVSKMLNSLPSSTDPNEIKSMARRARDAEADEDSHRSVLAAAAGQRGRESSDKIMRFTPLVIDGLNRILERGTKSSVLQNIPLIERAR